MNNSNGILLLLYAFVGLLCTVTQSNELSTPSINLIARHNVHNVVLICDVQTNNASDWNIYLTCPFIVGRLCYINCKSNCPIPNDCLPMISSCSIHKINPDHVRLKWSIDTSYANKSGEWQCSQRTNNSNFITLGKYKNKSTVTNDIITAVNTITTEQPDIVTLVPPLKMEIHKTPENKLYYHHFRYHIWPFLTQPNIVLVLVCIFTVSLLLNIVFLIRCALFRSVIDNYLQAKKSPNSCLFRCFCIPVSATQSHKSVKIPNQYKSSMYNSYRRDDIYDDMSSGSQTDKHLTNTFPSCLLDHDRLLPRKVCNPDGSHSLLNRTTHVCPSQTIGNYVYVAGPMCANRNYIPLNTPSNASLASNSQHTYTTDLMGRSPSNEFQRPEYCSDSDNAIYSQPTKNRIRCFDPIPFKYSNNFATMYSPSPPLQPPPPPPPVPPLHPERSSYPVNNHRYSLVTEPISNKNVDLIEHLIPSNTQQLA